MAILNELKARLRLDTTGFAKGLKGVQRDTLTVGQKMRQALLPAAAALTAMSAGLAVAVKGQLDQADEMSKAAQKFGVPIKELSRLKYAGDLSGVSMETLGISLGQMSKKMQAAMGGGKSAKLFEDLGISIKDSAGNMRSSEDVLGQIADKMASMPDGAAKTALSMQLLGKSGAEMIPMLNGGAAALRAAGLEAEAMGLVIDEKTGRAAENFNDNISRLKGTLSGLVTQLTAALAPALADISEKAVVVAQWFQKLSPDTKAWAASIIAVSAAVIPAVMAVGLFSGALGTVITAIKALTLLFVGNPIGIAITAIAVGAALIYQNWDGISAWFAAKLAAVRQEFDAAWSSISLGVVAAYDAVTVIWAGLRDYFTMRLSEIPQLFADLWVKIKDVTAQWYADFLAIGGQLVDGLKQGIQDKWDGMVAWFGGLADGLTASAKDFFGIHSPSRVFREIGQFITEGLGLGIKDNAPMAEQALGGVVDKISGQTQSLTSGMQSFRDNARSTFVSVITGAKRAGAALKQMAQGYLSSWANSTAGAAFDGIGKIFGFAKGAAFQGGKVTAFANGGVVSRATNFGMSGGGLGLMGEAGPEAIMPLTRGAGGKLGVQAHGGAAQSLAVAIGFDASSGGFTAFVRDQAGRVVASASQAIVQQSVAATYKMAQEVPIR